MTTHEVLVKARERMKQQGVQRVAGWFSSAENLYCAAGVIACETGESRPYSWAFTGAEIPAERRDAIEALGAAIEGVEADALGRITFFNDRHSHAEVLAAFDKAIAATAPAPDMSWLKAPESVPA